MAIDIRDLASLDDFRRVVDLEKTIWGYTESDDVVGVPILVVTVKRGGILLGAFDDRDRLVGFVYSLPGLKHGRPMQWSHMLGVLPDVRDAGLGARLKVAQRSRALAMGLDLIEWTFDPLQAPNAHLNFAKLGVIVRQYEENVYGDSSSPLHWGTPTDRFVAEWWIRRAHVERRLARRPRVAPPAAETPRAALVNATAQEGAGLACRSVALDRTDPSLLVEIPADFSDMLQRAPDAALAWRLKTRQIFMTYLARGYRVVDFFFDRGAAAGRYLLSLEDAEDRDPA
jgi:predicted GNAT superfamily acetyltransferase